MKINKLYIIALIFLFIVSACTKITEGITGTKTDTIGGTLTSTIGGTHTLTSPTAAITYNAGEITVNSITQTAHTHPQNNGNDAGGGTSTSGPEG